MNSELLEENCREYISHLGLGWELLNQDRKPRRHKRKDWFFFAYITIKNVCIVRDSISKMKGKQVRITDL